jgi:hypothetical protein
MAKEQNQKSKLSHNYAIDAIVLKSGAACYVHALYQHQDTQVENFDNDAYGYIMQQAHFVSCFPDDCLAFLRKQGVEHVSFGHLQYFFSVVRVWSPYMKLWEYCYQGMYDKEMLPRGGRAILNRLLATADQRQRFFKIDGKDEASSQPEQPPNGQPPEILSLAALIDQNPKKTFPYQDASEFDGYQLEDE